MMTSIENLEIEINKIRERNKRVELDKVWETSWTRRVLIFVFTYLAIAIYLKFVVGINPWINSIIPAVGFVLSTLTLPFFKTVWRKYIYKN